MLVTGKEILDHAHKNGYAVGAFNVVNMEMLQAVVEAAEEENPLYLYRPQRAPSPMRALRIFPQ